MQEVQGDFGTIAVGQGSITAELFPALEDSGISAKEIAKELPAAATLSDRWTEILNDLTPMIGVMSDNVANYQAVAALPPFGIFPWLFVFGGLAALGFALLAGRVPVPRRPGASAPSPRRPQTATASPPVTPSPHGMTERVGPVTAVEPPPPLVTNKR